MHLGVLTTSWPSAERPWAGHFIRDQTEHLARVGHRITVVASSWTEHGALLAPGSVELLPAPVRGSAGPLVGARGLAALASLRWTARQRRADVWLCHWWPTVLAVPPDRPCVGVLHGSDVDLLERMPRAVARWLAGRCQVVAVSRSLSQRFDRMARGSEPTPVHGMGARVPVDGPEEAGPLWWRRAQGARVLTVGRDHPDKGLSVAREVARRSRELAWLVVCPSMGFGPNAVRSLMAQTDVLVVPSVGGVAATSEGRPHVIAQGTVAGVPMVGGPNHAVRAAMRELGQIEVPGAGSHALGRAVHRALDESAALRQRLTAHGEAWAWESVARQWIPILERMATSRS